MISHINDLKYQCDPLHYKFSRDSSGGIYVRYKGNSTRPWIPMDHPVLSRVPPGQPNILLPSQVHKLDLKAIRRCIERCRYNMSGGEGQYRWWTAFLTSLNNLNQSEEEKDAYAREDANWALPQLRHKARLHLSTPKRPVPSHLLEMIDKELDDPKVILNLYVNNLILRQSPSTNNIKVF